MSTSIDVRGIPEVQQALRELSAPASKKALQKASTAGAKVLKPYVKAEAPRGKTGNLIRSISSRQARKERPAAVVVARPKVAYYRHWVIRGTAPHMIRFPNQKAAGVPKTQGHIPHPGIRRGNDFMTRGFNAGRDNAEQAIEKVMGDYVDAVAQANAVRGGS